MSCPECGATYVLAHKETHTGFFDWLRGDRFETTVSTPRYQHSVAPTMPQAQEAIGRLEPGESVYRQMDTRTDVAAPFMYALVWAGEIVVLCGTIALAIETSPWFLLITVGDIAFSVAFGIVTSPMLRTSGLDIDGWLKTRVRDSENAQPQGSRSYHVEGRLETKPGQLLYLKFELDDYRSALAWHRFCKAVAKGRNFSYREAKRHKLSDEDWERIYDAFVSQHWCTAAGERETSKLKPTGRAWVRQYARTPPPE